MISSLNVDSKRNEVRLLELEVQELELREQLAQLKAERPIDGEYIDLQEELDECHETIKKQNQILLHIKAELEAAKQYNPFNLVLISGSIENISNIVDDHFASVPTIDEWDGGCVGCCKVVDIAAKLQEELESTRNMYRSSSDECCGQRKTIGDLRTKIWELERTLPANFWDVVAGRDATIRKQRTTIGELNDENLSLRVTINDMAKKHIWYKNTIEELKDRNAEDLKELYDLDKAELSSMKHNYEIILQNRRNRGDKLEDNIKGLEAELSARKEDSAVLKEVVEIVKNWDDLSVVDRYSTSTITAMRRLYNVVKDYTDAPEGPPETPIDETQDITVTFAFLELP